jgi:hypothetical protein
MEFIQLLSVGVKMIDQLVDNRQYDLAKNDLTASAPMGNHSIAGAISDHALSRIGCS